MGRMRNKKQTEDSKRNDYKKEKMLFANSYTHQLC